LLISLIGSAVVGRAATALYQALAWYWKRLRVPVEVVFATAPFPRLGAAEKSA
jgi:hypothetical protein